ncbi:MAG: hypothetical protein KA116_03535 [Proteobacteria bacterium]|nr:hypothetical protein [Pseudomonadota bacterium]
MKLAHFSLVSLTFLIACSSHEVSQGPNPFLNLSDLSFSQGEQMGPREFRLVFQGNVKGELGTCGCAFNPTGGIDRKLNFLKSQKGTYLYLDSGNSLFGSLHPEKKDLAKSIQKAVEIAKAHLRLGVSLQNVGRYDLVAGIQNLKKIASESKLELISSNIVDEKDDFIFLPFKNYVLDNGLNVSVVGFTNPAHDDLSYDGFAIKTPVEKLKLLLNKIPQDHLLLVLSDLTTLENQQLASEIFRPHVIIGSSGFESYKIPLQEHNGIQLQGLPLGQELGMLELIWKSDAESWFNQGAKELYIARWNDLVRERKYFSEFPDSEEKSKEIEKNEADFKTLSKILPKENENYIPFRARTFSMDASLAQPNEFTKIVKKWN